MRSFKRLSVRPDPRRLKLRGLSGSVRPDEKPTECASGPSVGRLKGCGAERVRAERTARRGPIACGTRRRWTSSMISGPSTTQRGVVDARRAWPGRAGEPSSRRSDLPAPVRQQDNHRFRRRHAQIRIPDAPQVHSGPSAIIPGRSVSALCERIVRLVVFALRLGLSRVGLVGEKTLDALVEVLGRNSLRFAGRKFACHLGLRFVAQGTGLRGGMPKLCAVRSQNATPNAGCRRWDDFRRGLSAGFASSEIRGGCVAHPERASKGPRVRFSRGRSSPLCDEGR